MNKALTPTQRAFAEKHHSIVYSFLKAKRLPENDYYDVIIFGYLKAVAEHLTSAELHKKYPFEAIAFVKMRDALYREYKRQNRIKRSGITLSLDASLCCDVDNSNFCIYEIVNQHDAGMIDFEISELMQELAEWLSPAEIEVIRLRKDGYAPFEISRELKISPVVVSDMLRSSRETILAVCA